MRRIEAWERYRTHLLWSQCGQPKKEHAVTSWQEGSATGALWKCGCAWYHLPSALSLVEKLIRDRDAYHCFNDLLEPTVGDTVDIEKLCD